MITRVFRRRCRRGVEGMAPAHRVALKPVSAVAGSLLTMVVLVVATRQGQLPDIAGYTAGASMGALVSAVAGSGTSLAYVTGDSVTRRGVRRVRHIIVAPAMVASVGAASLAYGLTTELTLMPILFGGFAVVLNNLAELDSASIERKLQIWRLLIVTVASRSVGLAAVLGGVFFSGAMLLSSVTAYLLLRGLARAYTSEEKRSGGTPRLGASLKVAYDPSLVALSVAGIVIMRGPLIVAPFIMPAASAGALSALISAQQSLAAVLISGLYTIMAARAEAGSTQRWMQKMGSVTVCASALLAGIGAFAAPIVVAILSLQEVLNAGRWWALLSLAILPYVHNRSIQYRLLGEGRRRNALLLLGVIASLTLLQASFAAGFGMPTILAATPLIAESAVACSVAICRFVRRFRAKILFLESAERANVGCSSD